MLLLASPRADVSSEITQTAFESRENRQKQKWLKSLVSFAHISFLYLCGIPAINLDLEVTYFSDFEDVKFQLS